MAKILVVKNPVVNLRKEPRAFEGLIEDPLQETQLLLGEALLGKEERDGWYFVHAPHQPHFGEGWSGYPGWVRGDDVLEMDHAPDPNVIVVEQGAEVEVGGRVMKLSVGTNLETVGERGGSYVVELPGGQEGLIDKAWCKGRGEEGDVIEWAESFLGMPYFWGGRSSYIEGLPSSVDCSGLVSLVFELDGYVVPRNAHDQYLRCLKVDELQRGDLIFTAREKRMGHVMLFDNPERLIEASSREGGVRCVGFREKFGVGLERVNYGDQVGGNFVFFGRFSLNEKSVV